MHFKDALAGSSYGNITYYYRPISGSVNSLATSSGFIRSTFSPAELNTIEALKTEIPSSVISEFDVKYAAWKNTWSDPEIAICSNPRGYAESEEYFELFHYCQKYGKVTWPLFIDKLADGDVFDSNLLEDLTSPQKENKKMYDEAVSLKTGLRGVPSPFIYSNMEYFYPASGREREDGEINVRLLLKNTKKAGGKVRLLCVFGQTLGSRPVIRTVANGPAW